MEIKFSKSIMENILSIAINFTEKDNSQITSHILIEANEELIIRATDGEFGVEFIDNTTEIITKGKTTLNSKKFYEIIKALNDDFITLKSDEKNALITQNHSNYRLPTFESNEYPHFPNIQEFKQIDLNSLEFIEGLKKYLM